MEKSILVPHDFTEVGNYAMEHAYMVGKAANSPIHLIHIAKSKSQIDSAKQKLQEIADNFKKGKNVEIVCEVRTGNLFKGIYAYGLEVDAYLGVMGTHGIKNVKKAMKVVKKFMKIPFILVQNPVIFGEYDRIVIPLDHDKNARIKTLWVRYINNIFESKVFIISYNTGDEFKAKTIKNNILFAQNQFDNNLIDYEIKVIESPKNFADSIYTYANEVESDLILVMTNKYKSYVKDLKKLENLELYKKIPIMCVNKRTDIIKLGGFG
ncbi:MAG: universal stress protein [Bacteroidales bacterium]|nr:universal stress protein [Bacteroidales bacterium]MDD4218082.1 universal stress protein [Bacteroidales bacterium]MDY0143278.1 universal stress protein [Bacteroidales bacterium]